MEEAVAIEENLFEFYGLIGRTDPARLYRNSRYCYFRNLTRVWPEIVFDLSFPEEQSEEMVDHLLGRAQKGEIPHWLMPRPSQTPKAFSELLRQRRLTEDVWCGMALKKLPSRRQKGKSSFTITSKIGPKEFEDWLHLVGTYLIGPEGTHEGIFKPLSEHPRFDFYVGYLDDLPISSAMTLYHENTCGVYLVVTATEHQRKGYGMTLMNHILVDAQKRGAEMVVLQATPEGHRLYEKLGFEEIIDFSVFDLLETSHGD